MFYSMPLVLLTSFLLTWHLSSRKTGALLPAHTNERTLHKGIISRAGGLAIYAGILVGTIWIMSSEKSRIVVSIFTIYSALVFVSLIDDAVDLKPALRLIAHIFAAATFLFWGVSANESFSVGSTNSITWISTAVLVLAMTWMINLYNFMDGIDGLAAGMTIIGFGALFILGLLAQNYLFSAFCAIVAVSVSGFLIFNWHPASIFMGDSGSIGLGFLAGASIIWAWSVKIMLPWIGVLIFFPFIVDATYTLAKRIGRRERIWQAHNEHLYQKLVKSGWAHTRVSGYAYVLMLGTATTAIAIVKAEPLLQGIFVLMLAAMYTTLIVIIERKVQ